MTDKIIKYEKSIFTNKGQSDVDGFAEKLVLVADDILKAGAITVYYGFHGDENGKFFKAFTDEELSKSLKIAKEFPKVTMVQISAPDDIKIDYAKHNQQGMALFTWCDSENYIRNNKCLPDIVK